MVESALMESEKRRFAAMSTEDRISAMRAQAHLYKVSSDFEAALMLQCGFSAAELRNATTGSPIGPEAVKMSKAPLWAIARLCNGIHPGRTSVVWDSAPEQHIAEALNSCGGSRFHAGGSGYEVGAAGEYHPGEFPRILSAVYNKLIDRSLLNSSASYFAWTGEADELDNFKPAPTLNISSPSQMPSVGDAEAFSRTRLNEEQVDTVQIARYGQAIGLSPLTLAADGTKALQRAAAAQAEASNGTTTMVCVGLLVRPDNLADGSPLFHANHGNLITTPGNGAPNVTTWNAMNDLMVVQKKPDGNAYIDARPRIALVPPGLEIGARQSLGPNQIGPSVRAMPNGELVRENIDVIPEPELQFYESPALSWYALANPAMFPAIVRVYMSGWGWQGRRSSWTDMDTNTLFLSMESRVGVGVQNYRYIAKNPGQ